MVTTETALLTVKVGYDRQAERDALSTLLGQAGLQAVHRAVAEEDQTKLLWLVEWTSYAAHKTFMESDAYKPFMATLGKILDTSSAPPVEMGHYELEPPISKLLPKGDRMLERFTFVSDASSSDLKSACDGMLDAIRVPGPPATWGTAQEDDKQVSFFFLWPSVADHMKARKDPKFAKAGPALFKVATKNKAMMHFNLESLSPTKAKL